MTNEEYETGIREMMKLYVEMIKPENCGPVRDINFLIDYMKANPLQVSYEVENDHS